MCYFTSLLIILQDYPSLHFSAEEVEGQSLVMHGVCSLEPKSALVKSSPSSVSLSCFIPPSQGEKEGSSPPS